MAKRIPVVATIINISQSLDVVSTITCNKCGCKESVPFNEDEAAEYFAIQGQWYATLNNVYCKKCRQKQLKRQS